MAEIVQKTDLPQSIQSEDLVDLWLAGANASAARVAPCLVSADPPPTQAQSDEAKLVLVGTILRWSKAGSGGISSQQQTAGVFGMTTSLDTTVKTGYNLWPSEVERLQAICKDGRGRRAFSVDTI